MQHKLVRLAKEEDGWVAYCSCYFRCMGQRHRWQARRRFRRHLGYVALHPWTMP